MNNPADEADLDQHEAEINRRLAEVWRDSRLGPTVESLRHHILRAGDASLDLSQYRPLHALCEHGPMPMNQLARSVGSTPSSVSRAVQQLERARLVRRVRSHDDQRSFTISVTPEGRAMHQYLVDRAFEVYGEIFSVFTVEDRQTLAVLLERLLKSADSVLTSGGDRSRPAPRGACGEPEAS